VERFGDGRDADLVQVAKWDSAPGGEWNFEGGIQLYFFDNPNEPFAHFLHRNLGEMEKLIDKEGG
jgi:hypothetical protein